MIYLIILVSAIVYFNLGIPLHLLLMRLTRELEYGDPAKIEDSDRWIFVIAWPVIFPVSLFHVSIRVNLLRKIGKGLVSLVMFPSLGAPKILARRLKERKETKLLPRATAKEI